MASRRQFIKTGLLGGAALAAAAYFAVPEAEQPARDGAVRQRLRAGDAAIVAALAPALLGLPAASLAPVVDRVDRTIAALPPAAQQEIKQLFDLLASRWGRRYVAGVRSPWAKASPEELERFLAGWRDSRFSLLRGGYQGLQQLISTAWYGYPGSWAGIGYRQPDKVMEMLP
ncbi:hypothetical protein CEK28_02705 [Xenophilus sp. AP218F]|nr:twin-arginine translocation signal domain-containing protein [Chromobacterium sp. ASV5]OWY40457.1 hypothetical protein CEK28_02705 [Xenophilus sp. AP218F]